MSVVGEPRRSNNIVQRAMNIILRPSSEWAIIDAEPATVPGLITGYAMILAAIGPICAFIGQVAIGTPTPFGVVRLPVVPALINAVMAYIAALVAVFVFGLVIDALASNFGGTKDRVRAMKVAVYSATPAWLSGVFGLIPMIGILAVLGLYGIFLLYRGLNIVMRAPKERTTAYTAVVVLAMVVVWILLFVVIGSIAMATGGAPAGLAAMMHPHSVTTTTSSSYTTSNP